MGPLVVLILVCAAARAAGTEITASQVQIDLSSEVLRASGHVALKLPGFILRSTWLELAGKKGLLTAGDVDLVLFLPKGPVQAIARSLSSDGTDLTLTDGTVALCPCEAPPWIMGFSRLQADLDGDVTIRAGWIRLGRGPTLPVPWMMFRTGRKPGLLPPQMGWLSGRGPHLSLGAAFALPADLDLGMRLGWVAPDGLSLKGFLAAPERSVAAMVLLDPVDGGVDAGWMAGVFSGGHDMQRYSLVLDLPLSDRISRADMPGQDGGARRVALSDLAMHLRPSVTDLWILMDVGIARSLLPSTAHGLTAAQSWVRAPSVSLVLGPHLLGGRRVPLCLFSRVQHEQLVRIQGSSKQDHLQLTGVDLVVSGRFLPGSVVDLRTMAGWHGLLVQGGGEVATTRWSQTAAAGIGGSLALLSPTFAETWAHRLELRLQYRGAYHGEAGDSGVDASGWVARAPPSNLIRMGLLNALMHGDDAVLTLDLEAILVGPSRQGFEPHLGLDARVQLAPSLLQVQALIAPGDGGRGSVISRLFLPAGRADLRLTHIWIARDGLTRMDLEYWGARALLPDPVASFPGSLHVILVGLRLQLTRTLVLDADGGMDLDSGRLAWVRAAAKYSHPCGCLHLGIVAMQRAGLPAPDLLVTLSL